MSWVGAGAEDSRALSELINVASRTLPAHMEWDVRVSYVEIYLEKIQDLLAPNGTSEIRIMQDSQNGSPQIMCMCSIWCSVIIVYRAIYHGCNGVFCTDN